MLNIINSEDNGKIKFLRSLKIKKIRNKESVFIAEGEKVILEALSMGVRLRDIFISESFHGEKWQEISDDFKGLKVNLVPDNIFNKLADTVNTQGILAIAESKTKNLNDILPFGRYILLDGLNDPGNMGGIIRSADAFSFDGIIVGPNCVDPFNEKVIRSTMASIFRTNLYIMKSQEDISLLKKKMFRIYATTLNEKSKSILDVDLKNNVVLIIGNEANGVSEYFIKEADESIIIPMTGNAESLNASIAASICMYESMRQKAL